MSCLTAPADACAAGCDGTDAPCFPATAAFADRFGVVLLAACFAASACGALVLGGAFEAAPNENIDPAAIVGRLAGAEAADGFAVAAAGAAGS